MSPARVVVRTAVPSDAAAVAALVQRAYRGEASRVGWTTEADLLDGQRIDVVGVAAKIGGAAGQVLVGVDPADHLVACCEIESRGSVAYFGMFAVEPALQGSGLGRLMLESAEQRAVDLWAVTSIEMTVIAQRTELIDWYVRRGYVHTGETRPFPYGDDAFGLPRRDDLVFVVLAKPLAGQT
jgi:ribosomal protein S18 acetylase RimI-like enzyme